MTIICFDPGNHTGWVAYNTETKELVGGTFIEETMYEQLHSVFDVFKPDLVVYETFNLYPGMSKHLAWNSFYPVEVIGILKYICWRRHVPMIPQAPSIKKYAGTIKVEDITTLKAVSNVKHGQLNFGPFMEHTKDALLHLMFYMRKNKV